MPFLFGKAYRRFGKNYFLLCADPRPINASRFGLVTKSEVDGFFREYVFGFMGGRCTPRDRERAT
jgi:hypothetical protein